MIGQVGEVSIVITCAGDVVRLADGKLLAAHIGLSEYTTPLFLDGVVYFRDMLSSAHELSAPTGDKIKAKELWIAELNGGEFFASPVLDDGRIYAASGSGVLSVLDAESGEVLSEVRLKQDTRTGKCVPPAQGKTMPGSRQRVS